MASVVVTSQPNKGLRHEIKAGKHNLVADAGTDIGGNDEGPDPHALMLSALGACTSMTLQLFAQKRSWDLRKVVVTLTEEQIVDPENDSRKIPKIVRTVEVEGELTAEQLDTLRQIADKCPIHKLLTGSKEITTSLNALVQK
jgi:uncharacterized OsmC-like protein